MNTLHIKGYTLILIVCVCLHASSFAQELASTNRQKAEIVFKNINSYFADPKRDLYYETNEHANTKVHSYLWPLCALFQAVNELEMVDGRQHLNGVVAAIEKYHNGSAPAPGFQATVTTESADTRYYDDNQWIGIAAMDIYARTKNRAYLNLAKKTYRFMMTGFDLNTGGGIYWRENDRSTKNTCANGPGILLALQLYKVSKDQHLLDTALILYRWTNERLQAENGLFYDAINTKTDLLDKKLYAYNAGTMLQANVLLYQITKQNKYLKEAERIANAASKNFFINGKFKDNYWFSAVLLRGFIALYPDRRDKIKPFEQAAQAIWKNEMDTDRLLGKKPTKTLIDQAAMLEIFARLAQFDENSGSVP